MNLQNLDISWPQLRGLHQLYMDGNTKVKLFSNPYILRLKTEKRLLRFKTGNLQIIEAVAKYKNFYEMHFLVAFNRYMDFFSKTNIASDGKRPYSTYDLETLIYIYEHKSTLQTCLTTERSFSAQLFRGSKYLENNQSVLKAVLKILERDEFPHSDPKEQQWRLVVDCTDPQAVILCENIAMLKQSDVVRNLNIEAWYVGGNNIKILEHLSADKLRLPLYYMCDWDQAGLAIFSRIKNILRRKAAIVKVLRPYDITARLPVNSPYHSSNWRLQQAFSGLVEGDFEAQDVDVIQRLIHAGEWIEEESQDFEKLLRYNGAI